MPITTTTITESFSSGTIRTTTTTLSGNAATKAKVSYLVHVERVSRPSSRCLVACRTLGTASLHISDVTCTNSFAVWRSQPAAKAAAPPPPAKNTEPELVALPRHDTDVFMNAPSIVALSLMDNWTPGMRQVLVDGMAAMLKDSPLLTATIVSHATPFVT